MSAKAIACGTAAFAALAIVLFVGAEPSRPAESVSYSLDGETWSATLPGPLFDRDILWVPGDRRNSAFHIFNDTNDDGRLVVLVKSVNPAFEETLKVSVEGRDEAMKCVRVAVPAREKLLIEAAVYLAGDAGNDTQKATADIEVVVQWDNKTEDLCSEQAVRSSVDGP